MPYLKGQHPGTTWHKSDFQCHTPRDRNWIGTTMLPGGTLVEEAAREAWAGLFIAECITRGVTAVAITDHHDVVLAPYLQRAAQAKGVIIFPGIEVTCSDNAQCLAILDPGADPALLEKLLNMLPGVMAADTAEPKTCQILPIKWTVAELFDAVRKEEHLRDNCIILPHFSDGDAHKHLNEHGQHLRFADLGCDGVYCEKPHAELDPGTLDKAYGLIAEWGTRRHAFIVTGDSRSDKFDFLGARGCWLKLGEPTVEAVRQALLADEARIAYQAPETPLERIAEIRLKSTLTGDDPLIVTFNPGFNAVIGGRGSGKTALLQYLRFGLARTERDLGRGSGREDDLIGDTLGDGFVEVVIEREGVKETWHRDLEHDQITVTQQDGTVLELTLIDARRRFRGRAFFQKQLSTTTHETASATDQITGIAAAEALDRRREIDESIQSAQRLVTTTLQQLVAHWQVKLERAQAITRVADLNTRIAAIADRLREEGVSPEHLAIIADAPRFARGKSYLIQVNARINAERQRIQQGVANVLAVPMEQFSDITTFPELAELSTQVEFSRTQILAHLDAALGELQPLVIAYGQALTTFIGKEAAFNAVHTEAVALQTAHRSLLEENNRLTAELAAAAQRESDLAAQERTTAEAVTQFGQARAMLKALIAERFSVLEKAAEQVAQKSSELLKARPKHDPAPESYVRSLGSLMDRSYVQDVEAKCSSWVTDAIVADPDDAWDAICNNILATYEAKIMAGRPPEAPDSITNVLMNFLFEGGAVSDKQAGRIYQNLNDANVGAVVSAVPNDYIVMTYVDDGRNIEFAKASPGQQASALLELLLRQFAGTLIIDQPEDDLDNRVIMKIVELIRTSKNKRQLIFSTHNPNIVVNGDADKVVALKSSEPAARPVEDAPRVQLLDDGAIETKAVRDAITHIMEGGQAAFDLRGRKYRFDAQK